MWVCQSAGRSPFGQGGDAFRGALLCPLNSLSVLEGRNRIATGLRFFVGVLDCIEHRILIVGVDNGDPHPGEQAFSSMCAFSVSQPVSTPTSLSVSGSGVSTTRASTRPTGFPTQGRIIQGAALIVGKGDFQGKIRLLEAPSFNVLHIHGQPALQLCPRRPIGLPLMLHSLALAYLFLEEHSTSLFLVRIAGDLDQLRL